MRGRRVDLNGLGRRRVPVIFYRRPLEREESERAGVDPRRADQRGPTAAGRTHVREDAQDAGGTEQHGRRLSRDRGGVRIGGHHTHFSCRLGLRPGWRGLGPRPALSVKSISGRETNAPSRWWLRTSLEVPYSDGTGPRKRGTPNARVCESSFGVPPSGGFESPAAQPAPLR